LAVSNSNLIATTWGYGIFVSTNSGQTWSQNYYDGNQPFYSSAEGSGSTVFAGSTSLVMSTNSGINWQTTTFPEHSQNAKSISFEGNNILVATEGWGASYSTNFGANWTFLYVDTLLNSFYSSALKNNILFLGTYGKGVYRSTNGGLNFSYIGLNNNTYITSLAFSGTILYAGTSSNGVYISLNNGDGWNQTALTGKYINDILTVGSTVYASVSNGEGVYVSSDNGFSWIQRSVYGQNVLSLAYLNPNIYCGTQENGVFKSVNNGQNWSQTGINNSVVYSHSSNETHVFAGTRGGVYYSTDNGSNFVLSSLNNQSILKTYVKDSRVYAGTISGLYVSSNNGIDWSAIPYFNGKQVSALYSKTGVFFAGLQWDGVHFSTDEGQTWSGTGIGNGLNYAITSIDSVIFVGSYYSSVSGGGIKKSTNNGMSFTQTNFNRTCNSLVVKGNTVYAGSYGLFYSTDLGNNWLPTSLTGTGVNDIMVYGNLMFAAANNGFYLSTDSGLNWIKRNDGLSNQTLFSLTVSSGYIIAGSMGNGDYRRSISEFDPLPQKPDLISPADSSVNVPVNLTFIWNWPPEVIPGTAKPLLLQGRNSMSGSSGLNDNSDIISSFWFELTEDTVSFSNSLRDTAVTDTIKAISGLDYLSKFYWRVKAKNENGWGQFSNWWSFVTADTLPIVPQLILPANNSQEIEVTPLLDWSDISGAVKYRVQVSAFSNFSTLWIDDSSAVSSQFRVPNGVLAYNSVYYWRVKSKNTAGWGAYQVSPFRFFTLIAPPPPVPVLSAPANGAAGVELTPLLNWNDVTGSTKYRVQVSLMSDFSTTIVDDSSVIVSEYPVLSGLLGSNTQYFWRTAVKGNSNWSSFSSPWSFTTLGVPQPVILSSPLNNAAAQELDINFTWFKASELPSLVFTGSTKGEVFEVNKRSISEKTILTGVDAINLYQFELTSDTSTLSGIVIDSTLTDTSKFISGLIANTSYYWRVKAKNEIGWGAYSSWWKFTTLNNIPPAAPLLISPANSAINIGVTPLLDWSDVSGSEKYRVQVSAFSNFSVLWVDDSSSVLSQFRVPNGVLAYNSAYFWRVKAKNTAGWGEYQVSPFRFFTLVTPPPSAPVLLLPANGAVGVLLNPMLDWNNVSGAVKYRLQVSAMPDFSTLLIDDSSLTNSEFNVPAGILGSSSTYYWKAAAKDNSVWGDFSATWNFTTLGLPQPVVLTYPLNNAVEQPLNITFTWNKAAELLNKLTKSHDKNNNSSKIFVKSFSDGPSAISAYWFEMTTDTLTMTGLVRDTLLTDTLKNVNGLSSNTAYFWRVKAGNELGWGSFSVWWKFTTSSGLPPAPPVQIYPLNNAQNITVTPQLDWSDISGAGKYRIQVSALSNFSVLWVDDSNLTASNYQVNNGVLAYNSVYYWRIKAKNAAGWGNYQTSPFRFFTMIIPPPSVPVLVSPLNGATGISLTPLLDWNDVGSSVKYRILISADTGFSNIIVDDSTLVSSQYGVPAAMLVNSTAYYWKVAARNSMYWSTFSGKFSFKTFGSPQTVTLLSPVNNSIEQPLNITFSWMKAMESLKRPGTDSKLNAAFTGNLLFNEKSGIDAISKYWFELVTDTVSMSGLINDTALTDTVKSLTGLASLTNYFWRVKAFNEVGWGPFSMWWKFTTISGLPPAAPVLVYPANRAPDISVTPLLNWSDVPGAQKYYLQVSALSNFSVLWVNDSSITSSEFQVPNGVLAYNSGYYWRVKARNDAGWGNFQATPFRFFTLVTPPQAPPALVSPTNGAVNIPLTAQLDWSDITSAIKYRLQVSVVNTFVTTVVDDSSLTASQNSIAAGLLAYNTGYFWRVSVKTGSSWSAFSNSWSFTTVTALGSPALQQPLNKDTGIAVTTLFKWSNVAGATSYRLQVSAFSNFSVLWIDKYVNDTMYQTPNGVLAYNSRYFWKVKSLRAGDSSSFSNPNYFFTKLFPYSFDMPEFESSRMLDLTGMISTDSKASYSIEFCKDTLFTEIAWQLKNVKGEKTVLNIDSFDEYSTYFWRVCSNGDKPVYSDIRVLATYITKQSQLMSLRGSTVIPDKYALYQNYPNPFNPVCRIKFDIPENTEMKPELVRLVMYDLIGREIAVLVNDNIEAGTYEVNWNAADMPSGIYIYQLKTSSFTDSKKMVLLK